MSTTMIHLYLKEGTKVIGDIQSRGVYVFRINSKRDDVTFFVDGADKEDFIEQLRVAADKLERV